MIACSGSASAHLNYAWRDSVHFYGSSSSAYERSDIDENPSYGLLNGSVALSFLDGRLTASIWGQNILGKEYRVSRFGSKTGLLPSAGPFYTSFDAWAPPASYGVRLNYDY